MTVRFVVLRHKGVPEPHFDLMIESEPGKALMTWRSADWPIPHEACLTRLADHRRAYLEYEGPLTGDRGHVKRVAAGECRATWPSRDELNVEFPAENLRIRRQGEDQWVATPTAI